MKIIKENNKSEFIYKRVLNKIKEGVSASNVYNQPNIGWSFDMDPSDESINKVSERLESMGFKLVDHYEDDSYMNDSYIVYINTINGERIVCGIVYGKDFAFVNARYDDIEDSYYF